MTKDEAKKLSDILKSYSEGKIIEVSNNGSQWAELNMSYPDVVFKYNQHRIKPEPKLVPFTFEDRQYFKNLWVKSKEHDTLNSLVQISKDDVLMTYGVKNIRVTYSQLLKHYEFEDNSPCGKYINE